MRYGTEAQLRYVSALLRGTKDVSLGLRETAELESLGVLRRCVDGIQATAYARQWLRAEKAAKSDREAVQVSTTRNEHGFFAPHHLAAGERVRRLFDRANLQQRVTMAYRPVAALRADARQAGDISDMAADARKGLAEIHNLLPGDCAGAVIDVFGFEKGLQAVETERGWPRRSAKLVLRIGLEQLARHYGLTETAQGPANGHMRRWIGDNARPTETG